MKKLLIMLAIAGAGVFAAKKFGGDNHLKMSAQDIPDPVKKQLRNAVTVSEKALTTSSKMSAAKLDFLITKAAKVIGKDDAKAKSLAHKVSNVALIKSRIIERSAAKVNKALQ